jgi:tagaturonate reductase
MIKTLNRTTLAQAQDRPVKVLQFGKGNFLRAFADWMVDILNEKTGFNGNIQIVQASSTETDNRFDEQDGLYHVLVNGMQNGKPFRKIRLITAVTGVINPFSDYKAFLKTAENPHLQFIVSNATEAGIAFDPADRDPDVTPATFPGKLTALLHHRYEYFKGDPEKAVVVLPCELIEKNGEALRNIIFQYIAHWKLDERFRRWIGDETLFCNTLVDRIVPGFPKDKVDEITAETGYDDKLIVSAEPYHLWVIEPIAVPGFSLDTLKSSLPLEQAGLRVKFVNDLNPYRTSKVRILNGAHTCMVPLAYLRGLRTVREAIDDPHIGAFIRGAIREEIIPTLDLPKAELQQFAGDVIERFQNPFIRHELLSIALNSLSKFQVRVLPSILEYNRRTGRLPGRLLRSLAGLILFYKGEWKGERIPLNDTPDVLSFFSEAWRNGSPVEVVEKVLSNEGLWKTDLTKISGLAAVVTDQLTDLARED